MASDSHVDLGRAPYVVYVVKYIDLVPLAPCPGRPTEAEMISEMEMEMEMEMGGQSTPNDLTWVVRPMFCMVLNI